MRIFQITDGIWQQPVNLSSCFSDSRRQASIISVEIRDRGTGNRGESTVTFDPLAAGFEIVPLRPVFNARTKNILVMTYSTGAPTSAVLGISFHCLGDVKQSTKSTETLVGNVLSFAKPSDWDRCHVIVVQATRHVGTMKTRTKTLMLPIMVDVSSMEPSWIEIASIRAAYAVGESLNVTVPKAMARSLNYLVLCNSLSVPATGQIRDDGTLTIRMTRAMIGRCILFVYSLDNKPTTDMMQFNVVEQCQVSTFASRDTIKPGTSVTFTLNGEPHGIAVMRAMDDRLNSLNVTNEAIRPKSWDFSMFHRPELKANQAKLLNFVALKEVRRALELSCALGGSSYFQQFGICPDAKVTQSALSNFCLNVMVAKCMNPEQPTVSVSTACDSKNPRNCGLPLKKAASVLERFSNIQALRASDDISVNMFSDNERLAEEDSPKIRERFHEVWLFDAIPLGASGTASRTLKAPDTVGRWSVSSVFWALGQRDLCPAANVHVTSKKDVFLEVDLPKSVFINETVTAKVSVIALNPQRETKYSVCLSEMSRKICADLGSFGQLGQPSYSRVVVSPSQPIDTKTFTLRFLSTGSTKVTFQLREETSFPGKHHCDIGEVYDSVRLNIFIAKRDETEEIYKRLILNANKPLTEVRLSNAVVDATTPRDIFHVTEYRSPLNADMLVTDVHTNILDSDAVYSYTIDISKFLPIQPLDVSFRRSRRSLEQGNSFLSDILKKLSVELYQFKRIKMLQHTDVRTLEASENRIGSCCDIRYAAVL
ncbi:hypothetical protein Y032_0209g2107 [Ancylostoma ceylanicum]|uniref:Alpha-2-macroglobulin domain-containing protein n=1 Tax=Ancylostoma ceylanicum TaxID=53326 RepID=A0A016SLH2_9BILA|nr:hypothetical protein Y032_0209g2107 [Ancylostoma ceylanicum]